MIAMRSKILARAGATAFAASLILLAAASAAAWQEAQPAGSAASRPVGTVKAIAGSTITLTTDAKTEVTVQIQESTRLLRTAPGQRDLSGAKPMTLPELQVGDRMLARGTPSADGKSVVATSVMVMTRADVAQKQERDVEDWNRRGVGGLVKELDAASGTVTLATAAAATAKPVVIRVSKDTIVRRYAPDSIKFDDAVRATLDQIRPGDQVRARGNHSADGSELQAEEIVAGTFRNVAGTINAIDAATNTVTVTDLATKKTVSIRITADSQLRKLPAMAAQLVAARLRGTPPNGGEGAAGGAQRAFTPREGAPQPGTQPAGGRPGEGGAEGRPTGANGGVRGGRGGDIQQMLSRMPAVTLAELQKGDAIMVVTTQGSPTLPMVAITLLSGVEPILTAAPNGNRAAMLLTPWNLGGGGGEGE